VNESNPQSRAFFEEKYRSSSDPWHFASASYERNRYHAILAVLDRPTYRRAYEPGCSIGVLTAALAPRCRHVVACDISARAVELARARCKDLAHVRVVQRDVADAPPEEQFDLIVFSEIGYYFSASKLREVALGLAGCLEPGGDLIAVHWLGHSADHLLHGDEVHEVLASSLPYEWTAGSRHAGFRIDSWRRSAR
jgi:SAM-dependent methyltransferase